VVPRRRGIHVNEATRWFGLVTRPDGLRVADAERVAFDAAARRPLPKAVAVLDAMTRAGLVQMDTLVRWLEDEHGNGVPTVREAVPLVDPRAESQPESVMRVVLVRAGLAVVPQYAVVSQGRLIARVDLALPEFKVAVEYDGTWHVLREQLERDRARLNALQAAGWTVVHVTAAMLRDADAVVAAVRAAVARLQRAS